MKSQRSNIDRDKLIKDDVKIGIDEVIKQKEKINNNLKNIHVLLCICKN